MSYKKLKNEIKELKSKVEAERKKLYDYKKEQESKEINNMLSRFHELGFDFTIENTFDKDFGIPFLTGQKIILTR